MKNNQIIVTPTAIVYVLGAVASLVILASIGSHLTALFSGHGAFPSDDPTSNVDELVLLFSVDKEENVPTYFSTFLLIFAALLLSVITVLERKRNNSYTFYWAILSSGFLVMAGDELLQFHERVSWPVRKQLGLLGDDYWGIFHYAWVIPYFIIVAILGLFFLRFWLSLPKTTRLAFLLAATLYIGGAIGCELVGGYIAQTLKLEEHMIYVMITTLEEGLEMAGVIVFIWALLLCISQLQRSSRMV